VAASNPSCLEVFSDPDPRVLHNLSLRFDELIQPALEVHGFPRGGSSKIFDAFWGQTKDPQANLHIGNNKLAREVGLI